jgi:hypothetical protein
VKTETLDWLAKNPFYTKRFAYYVGRRCRVAPIKDVARELGLIWFGGEDRSEASMDTFYAWLGSV